MGKRVVEPPDIERILAGPGRGWTAAERGRVKEWLYDARPLEFLLVFALRHLGREAAPEDAEDAWGNFFVKRLDAVINLFDPARGRGFWNYLLFCFERFCADEREGLRGRPRPVPHRAGESAEGDTGEWDVVDAGPGPEAAVAEDEVRRAVWKCIRRLAPTYRRAIVMYYFDGMSVGEIAAALGISGENVRVRLHRGRPALADCIRKEGVPWQAAG